MSNPSSKIIVFYDESRIKQEIFLEHVVEPYLYFLAEKNCIDPTHDPTSLYEKIEVHGSLKGFEVACCEGYNNRFPEFKRDFGEFELWRLTTGVFYIGKELEVNQLTPDFGEAFILFNRKKITSKGIAERIIDPYFKEVNKSHLKRNKELNRYKVKCKSLYGDLRSFFIEDESISLKSLGLSAHSRKVDLKFLSNEVGFLSKFRISNGGESGSDDNLTLFPFGKKGPYRNVSE